MSISLDILQESTTTNRNSVGGDGASVKDTMMRRNRRSGASNSIFLLLVFLLSFASVTSQQHFELQYLDRPELRWMNQLSGNSVNAFNAVEQSPIDEDILYITTNDATLVVLSALDGSVIAQVMPPSNGPSMSCKSGVSFGVTTDGSRFLTYTVMDNPSMDSYSEAKSRVVAVSIPGHEIIWSSDSLPGESMGSPVVLYETTSTTSRKPYVALTHNTHVVQADNSTAVSGIFTLLDPIDGEILWTESESSRNEFPTGYSPPGVAANPTAGYYVGGEDNDNDFVVWGNLDKDGKRNLGNTYLFQLPQNFQAAQTDIQALSAVTLKTVRWTTMTRPIFGDQGTAMYFGVAGDQLRGWTGKNHLDEAADWEADLSIDSTTPLPFISASPALSMDGLRLFVSTSTSSIYGIDSLSGSTIWEVIGTSGFQSEPRVSPDDQRVYVAQSLDGQILSIDQQDGRVHWSISCDEFEADCSRSVLANFAVSSSGQYLYYADVFGNIIALTLGNFVETTTNGNDGEGARDNTGGDFFGEQTPTSSSHSQNGSSTGSRGSYIALVILGISLSLGIGAFIFLVRRERLSASRKTRASRSLVEHGSVYGFDDNNDFSPTEVLSMSSGFNEDDMILYPTMGSQREAVKEEYPEVYAQDCFPKPLRGSRRVAPFEEDYSFGAAVLV